MDQSNHDLYADRHHQLVILVINTNRPTPAVHNPATHNTTPWTNDKCVDAGTHGGDQLWALEGSTVGTEVVLAHLHLQ